MKCTLRRCQGRNGCICPKKPPPGFYGSSLIHTNQVNQDSNKAKDNTSLAKLNIVNKNLIKNTPKSKPNNKLPKIISNEHNNVAPSSMIDDSTKVDESLTDRTKIVENNITNKNEDNILKDGEVTIRYNHYKNKFQISKGTMKAEVLNIIQIFEI